MRSLLLALPLALAAAPALAAERATVQVHFATDRATDTNAPGGFGVRRDHRVHWGACDVTIEAGAPPSATARLQPRCAEQPVHPRGDVVVFVHGFNNSFAESVRAAAVVEATVGDRAELLAFSWPSADHVTSYISDGATAEWAAAHLRRTLHALVDDPAVRSVTLYAHSMGSRLATAAVARLVDRGATAGKIHRILLAAPDLDADLVRDDLAPTLHGAGVRTTVYLSHKDRALQFSTWLSHYARAGRELVPQDGVETIDVTAMPGGSFNHGYYADPGSVLADVRDALARPDVSCHERGLTEGDAKVKTSCVLTPDDPAVARR